MADRYDTEGNPEGTWQPGSDGQVLLNRLGITDSREMDRVELELLVDLYERVFESVTDDQVIRASDLCEWHRMWLGNVYSWAGQLRTVTMSKDGFPFAAVTQLSALMLALEREYLERYTPCRGFDEEQLIEAIAIVHVELILIHPCREGNGRLARLLADVMALQAGYPELDFSSWDTMKEKYFSAIHEGMGRDYTPMQKLVRQALHDAVSASQF